MTRLFLQLNRPGSGSTVVNQNDEAAPDIAFGKFIRIVYRGEDRGGFFVDDIDQTDASEGEEGERNVEVKGRGMLGILDQIIVSYINQGEATVTYSAEKIGYILDDLLTLGQGRGVYPNLIWDFSAVDDSVGEAWTVNHDLSFRVGSTLLQAIDQFADLGVDFEMSFNPGADQYVFSAFKDGIGSDVSANVVFRPGDNVIKASKLQEASGLRNAQLIEVADPVTGPKFVWDTRAGSIGTYGRLETYFQAGNAPTITEGLLLAAAELDEKADPRVQYSLVVSDASGAKVFEDYNIGDTVGYLNSEGTIDLVQVISLQLDFTKEQYYADVTVGLGVLIIDTEITSALKLKQLAPGVTGIAGGPSDPAVVAGALIAIHDADVTAHSPYLRNANKIQGFNIIDPGIDTPADNDLLEYNTVDAEWKYVQPFWVERAGDTMTGVLDMDDNAIVNVNYIDFDLINGVSPSEGRAVWNDDDGTLNIGMKGGVVNQQVGMESLIRGKNVTGSGTTDGKPARISGASGSNPEFGFSEADVPATAGSIGLFTEDIINNANGYVTPFGTVRDIDTTGTPVGEVWAAADRIYVGNAAGTLTNVSPTSTERIIFIGIVTRAHATEGSIWVNPINVSYLSELSGVTITGVADNELLAYDSGSGLWINQTPTEAGLDARYVEVAGDTMTGQLFIDGGADEIQLIVQANVAQAGNIIEVQDSSTTLLSGVDDEGRVFSYGGSGIATNAFYNGGGNSTLSGVNNFAFIPGAGASLTDGGDNILIGRDAGGSITGGDFNIYLGALTGRLNTGSTNTIIGSIAFFSAGAGDENTAVGYQTLGQLTSGVQNTALGKQALTLVTIGRENTAVGFLAGQRITEGENNVLVGVQAGQRLTTGSDNIFIGYYAGDHQTVGVDRLIIDNKPRTSAGDSFTDAILWGIMDAVPTNQELYINASIFVKGTTQINPGLSNFDTIISGDTEANLLRVDAGLDTVHIGDWDTNYFVTDLNGDSWWVGGGGLIFGHMYIPGVDIVVDITDANPTEVKDDGSTSADDGWSAGELNLVTFPGGGTEHYMTVPKPGKYKVEWDLSFQMAAPGANVEVHGGIMVDDAAVRDKGEGHRTIANNSDTGSMTGRAVIDCPNGTEEISLWVLNADNNNDITVEHGNVYIGLVGGT